MKKLWLCILTIMCLCATMAFAACGKSSETPATYTVTVAVNEQGYGTVSSPSVTGVAKDTAITVNGATLTIGDTAITATPTAATAQYTYAFVNWTGTADTVTGDITITANFSRTTNTYTVSIAANNADYGTVSAESVANVPYGTAITVDGNVITVGTTAITATATENDDLAIYYFDNWTSAATVTEDVDLTANFVKKAFALSKTMLDCFEQGNTLKLPTATIGDDETEVSATDPNGDPVAVVGNEIDLDDAGVYTVRYTSASNDSLYKEISVRSVATLGYVSASDGATTFAQNGNFAVVSGWNKDTVLTINKVADVSGATFAGGYLICQVQFGVTAISEKFGALYVKLTDYKDASNYFTIKLYDGDATKVNAKVQASGQDYNVIENVHFEGGMNLIFDYAENKVAVGDKDHYSEVEGFTGFTDDKCIITVYAEEWAVESTGVSFDWITDNRNYTVNLEDFYPPKTSLSGNSLYLAKNDPYIFTQTISLPVSDCNYFSVCPKWALGSVPEATLTVRYTDTANENNYYEVFITISESEVEFYGKKAGGTATEKVSTELLNLVPSTVNGTELRLPVVFNGAARTITLYQFGAGGQTEGIGLDGFTAETVKVTIGSTANTTMEIMYLGDAAFSG